MSDVRGGCRWILAVALALAIGRGLRAGVIEQSPIDIVTADVVVDPFFKPIVFQYASAVHLTVMNVASGTENGTIRGIPAVGSTLTYDAATYDLLQFHFHVDSEHAIDGRKSPMEIHFVNQKSGSSGTDDLLVVARFIEVGAPDAVLAPFFSAIADIPDDGDVFALTDFNLASLAPIGQPQYRYAGSLTTPPYTEGVLWNVFRGTPLFLSQDQIDAFAAAFPDGDSRPLQPLNGRIVTTAAVPEIDPAGTGSVLAFMGAALALLERRRSGIVRSDRL